LFFAAFPYLVRDGERRAYILRALEQAEQDRKEAAKLLDVSFSSLYRKIEELEVS
jgi:transcriptional regulator with PAS, ATPase and Fis domain